MKRCFSTTANIAAILLSLGASAAGAQDKVLYSFGATATDGTAPASGVIFDAKGNLYGTTSYGGRNTSATYGFTAGTAYELMPAAGGGWTEIPLYSFAAGATDGIMPNAGLILDDKGNLYGTTALGGQYSGYYTGGTVFELTPAADGKWTEKVLHSFGASGDGLNPQAGLIFDSKGNLYGTTLLGGANGSAYSGGTVFELSPAANGDWKETLLYSFGATASDGEKPDAGLIFDATGNLYGTTEDGGGGGDYGTVFELSPGANGKWTENLLYNFGSIAGDGANPESGLIFDSAGNLYGTTNQGGSGDGFDGTVFELMPLAGGKWKEKQLYEFGATTTDGKNPLAGLVFDFEGNLYGTTSSGGPVGAPYDYQGTVFELTPTAAGPWNEKQLYSFGSAANDARYPAAGLLFDAAYNLYGTTGQGGAIKHGALFEIPAKMVAPMEFSPRAGKYTLAQTVKIVDPTPDAAIYYTTNGDPPSKSTSKYTEPIEVAESETLTAIAYATGLTPSPAVAAAYVIGPPAATPRFSPIAGTFPSALTVKIADSDTAGLVIYYTIDGDMPTTNSTRYTAAGIEVSKTETIEAIATATGFSQSAVASATYTIEPPAATPVFSPKPQKYSSAQIVKLTCSTPDSTIYYTTDDNTPTTNSKKYTAAGIEVPKTVTIKAIATAPGYLASVVASATYTIE
jgi:uncharacterized repeat protein (TIGR03803 family)